MPYSIRQNKDGSYRVVNTETGEVKAAKTTLENAERQRRLLAGVEHGGFKPTGAAPKRPITSALKAKLRMKLRSKK